MRAFLLGLLAVFWSGLAMGQTTLYTFNGGGTTGNWSDANTWTTDPTGSTAINQRVPQTNDNIVVTNSFVVTLNANVAASTTGLSITIQRGGVLDLGTYTLPSLSSLSGQGTLRIKTAYFPTITTNNFAGANTGTVEFYNWSAGPTVLPNPTAGYNNLRLLNSSGTAYVVQLDNNLTLNGNLTLTNTNTSNTTPTLTLNLGSTASTNRTLTVLGDINIGAGAKLGVTNVAGSHTLVAGANFVNGGTVNLHNGTTDDSQVALLKFTGAKDANFACNYTTYLDILRVDKGVDSQVTLNVTGASGPTQGYLSLNHVGAPAKLLDLVNGVTKLSGGNIYLAKLCNTSSTDPNSSNSWYEMGTSATSPTLWIAGATVLSDNVQVFVIYGTYRISGGRLSSITRGGMVVREDAQVLVEGGQTTVCQFRPSVTSSAHRGSFTMTGGTFESMGMITGGTPGSSTFYNLTATTPASYNFARFTVPYITQGFKMTGGTLRVANPDFNDQTLTTAAVKNGLFGIGVNPNNANVSGGTIELWVPNSTAGNANIMTTSPLWNVTIKKPTAGGSSKAVLALVSVPANSNYNYTAGTYNVVQPITVLNNLTLDATNTPTFDASGQNVTIQGSFNIGTDCTYLTGTTNTTTFSGGQDQVLSNNGLIGATAGSTGIGTFSNWTINKPAGTLTLGGSVATYYTPSGTTLSLLNGVLNDGGKTINVQGNIVNSGVHTSGGGTGSIVMNGAANQTVGGDGTGIFGNLKVNSTISTAGATAVTLTGNITVTNVLTLQSSHILAIGAYRLSLTNVNTNALQPSNNFSSTRMIQTAGNQSDLGLQKTYGGPQSFTFPVGTASKFTPVTVNLQLSTALAKYGQVSVSPVNSRNPFVTGTTNSLAYYWKVRSVGFGPIPSGAITESFQMVNSDAALPAGGGTSSYIGGRYLPTAWNTSFSGPGSVNDYTTYSTVDFTALDQFDGEFTAGYSAAFGPITSFYSRQTGNWTTNTTWSTTSNTGAAVPSSTTPVAGTNYPGPGNPVFIGAAATTGGSYHTVTTTANGAQSGSLVIDRGSILDVVSTTGHNFGALPDSKVGGSGRLRVSSSTATATFPGGDFGSFIQAGGGTVEYYTSASSPTAGFTVPTSSGTLTLNQYRNLWLNATSATQTITLPAQNLRIYAQLKTGVANGGTTFPGTVLISSAAAGGNLRADSLLNVMAGIFRLQGTTARSLTFDTNVQVDNGATFDVLNNAAVTHALTVGGSLVNNGTLDFKVGTGLANLTFVGAQNNSFTSGGTSTTGTDLYSLTLNKGLGRAAQLTMDGSGTLTTPINGWLTLTNGTLNYTKPVAAPLVIHDGVATPYLITDNAGLTVNANGGTVTVATNNNAAADLRLAGQLTVTQGTLRVGASGNAGNDLEYASAGAPTITVTGGNLYVNGQLRRTVNNLDGSLRFDQSGGTIDIDGQGATAAQNNERGLFEVQGTSSIFRMSGGTLNLHRSNQKNPILTADLYLAPDSTVVTGGTVVLGNTAAGVGNVTISVSSTVPLYDLQVATGANNTNTNTGLLTGVIPLTLNGSLTIGNDNSFFNANGLGLNIYQSLVNNNTSASQALNAGGFQPITTTQTTTFLGGLATQLLTGTASNLTVFGGLTLNTPQTNGTLQLGGNALVAGTLTLTKGTLNDNDRTITVLGDVLNSATHVSGGTGAGSLILGGSANQNVGGNNKGVFGNLTLSNTTGATTTANQEITKVLNLTGGILNLGSNLLVLSNATAGAVTNFGTGHYIRTNGIVADLGVRKSYPAGALNFTFPLGSATKYTPVIMNVTANSAAGTLTVLPIDLAHPSTTDPATGTPNKISFYWKVSSTLSSPTVNMTYTYTDADVIGTEAYILGRFYQGAWTPTGGIVGSSGNATANTLSVSNYTGGPTSGNIDGDYTGGDATEFATVLTYYSRNATAGAGGGDWASPATWTTVTPDGSGPAAATAPTLANPVVINTGHRVYTSSNGRAAASLKLLGTGILDLGANAANNFSTILGTGTLRIGSSLFPAGNYSDFVSASGGTVEFTGAGQLPARDTYNNLTLSGTNNKQLSNLDLTLNGALALATNTIVDNPTSQSITLNSTSSGATIDGTLNMFDGKLTTSADLLVSSNGTLNLGAGLTQVGRNFTNNGTTNNGSAGVQVGAAFTNGGTYNAKANVGPLTVTGAFTNSGTYNAGTGRLTVSSTGSFTNASTGAFYAIDNGYVQVDGSYSNAGTYNAAVNILRVAGNFTNTGTFKSQDSNGQDVNSATLLFGNFTNSGTFTAGTGVVQFTTDDAAHQLTGNTGFYNLQKTGAYNLSFGANTNVSVDNLLTLSGGLITTGTVNTLQLNNTTTQPILGATPTSYVNGRLAMALPNAAASIRVFPVGLGGRYRPVTITPQAASTSPVVRVEIVNQSPTTLGTPDATLSNLSANRYYRIQLVSGSIAQPVVQLSFNTDVTDEQVNVPGNLRVAYFNTTPTPARWSTAGGAGVFSPDYPRGYTSSAAAQTAITATSLFALASTNYVDNPLTGQAPLPVQLLSFTAARQGAAVRLAWATASEKNSAYFVVERSADGHTFGNVEQVTAQGNSLSRHNYTTLDASPLAGLSYYRLRQVDLDGTIAYSPTVAVRADGQLAAPALVAYPNPTAGQSFQLLTTNLTATGGTVQLFDNVGRLVLTKVAAAGAVETTIQPAQPLASGLYFATWQTADGLKLTTKVVVN